MKKLTEYEKQTIAALREDARSLKDCFTAFSFQSIAFASAILGVIARYQPDYPFFGLASVATILLLTTVARIGTYKYGSANRQYGYELHLFRTRNLSDNVTNGWKASMRQIGWEEAMRAWRVVQPTIFRKLYYVDPLPNFLRREYRKQAYKWFDPEKLTSPHGFYYAGSYLSVMIGVLYLLAFLANIPLFFMVLQLDTLNILSLKTGIIIPILSSLYIGYRYIRDYTRVRVLESGLLSIHSSSIMWEAVVVAHYRALDKSDGLRNYTSKLAEEAKSLSDNIHNIHNWVRGSKFVKSLG